MVKGNAICIAWYSFNAYIELYPNFYYERDYEFYYGRIAYQNSTMNVMRIRILYYFY